MAGWGVKAGAKRKPRQNWLLWWRTDPAELDAQILRYPSPNPFKTARGVSALLLLASVLLTVVMTAFRLMPLLALGDAAVMAALAALIYFGHRWAMIAAMLFWTLEKVLALAAPLMGEKTFGTPIFQVFWWCLYMSAFFLAFRVEQERRKPRAAAVSVFD